VDNFYAYLSAADEGLGKIRRVLAELGKEKNTLIILLSDNGASGNRWWSGAQLAQKWVDNAGDEMTAPPAWAVRKGRRMLRYWSHLQRHELYDLESDLSAKHPQVVRELKADYAQWFKGTKKPMDWDEPAFGRITVFGNLFILDADH